MATETPLITDGAQTVAGADFRRSSITGSTLFGPNGSGQFLAVRLSTATPRTVNISTASGQSAYGILQNAPALGDAAAVGVFGVSKCVGGSSAIDPGMDLMVTSSGALIPYSSAAGVAKFGKSIEPCTAVGNVFSAFIYGVAGGGSVA